MSDDITRFRIDIPDADLDDLRQRLRQTRWPEPETVDDWSQGIPLAYLRQLCEYWREQYDWRASEARLNRFPQFRTEIDGLDIHFIHARSPHQGAMPLVITHGWPGSIVEFHKVIEPLTDPVAFGGDAADAFHVVCPSLPGYGFSGKPPRPGWGTDRTADAWDQLMARLGYTRYAAQGGDWGSQVTTALGMRHPDHLAGSSARSRCRSAARSSPRRSSARPGAGPRSSFRTCATGMSWTREVTLPPSSSRTRSSMRCGPASSRSADPVRLPATRDPQSRQSRREVHRP